MTLNDIIASALMQLDRGYDPNTLDFWRKKFTRYANDAMHDLASAIKPVRTDMARVNGSIVDTARLERPCLKVVGITQDGFPVQHTESDASGIISVRALGNVEVIYRYMPKQLGNPSDTPELPEYAHSLIVTYIVARERLSGDVSTQSGGNVFMQLYEAGKARLLSASTSGCKIEKKW